MTVPPSEILSLDVRPLQSRDLFDQVILARSTKDGGS